MRIGIVVSYVSANGSFGGPIAVAIGHAAELARRGHSVEFIAGWDGKAAINASGVDVKLFRAHQVVPAGFSGLVAPKLHRYLLSNVDRFDVIHIHMARDLITLPAALRLRKRAHRLVIQTHGMVMPDSRLRARLFDMFATRRVLDAASRILALTELESEGLASVSGGRINVVRIPNGVRIADFSRDQEASSEVLFLARLHPRKRVLAFAEMALILIREGRPETFHVVGPDEGDLQSLLRFIADNDLAGRLFYEGSIESGSSLKRLRSARVFVLPSVGEVFPMAVLESLSVGTPTVITTDNGLASQLQENEAALVTDGTPASLASATRQLLSDAALHGTLARNGTEMVKSTLSINAVVDELEALYTKAI